MNKKNVQIRTWYTFSALICLGFSSWPFSTTQESLLALLCTVLPLLYCFNSVIQQQVWHKYAFVQLGAINLPSPWYKRVFLPALTYSSCSSCSQSSKQAFCCRLRGCGLSSPNYTLSCSLQFAFIISIKQAVLSGCDSSDFLLHDDKNNAFVSTDCLTCLVGEP